MDEFEWDLRKNSANIALHQVHFSKAAAIFQNPVITCPDRRRDYGEQRFVSIGFDGDDCYVVVWTKRGANRRLISAWKGGRDERRAYRAVYPGRDPGDEPAR
ncbi:MAG: BrnT family toxin [Zymomonas sp.]|nr:MAG: BrnT family toxin [Zymomonas sp.]